MLRFLGTPMPMVQVKELRRTYKEFQASGNFEVLVEALERMRDAYAADRTGPSLPSASVRVLNRQDLHLICFDVVSS